MTDTAHYDLLVVGGGINGTAVARHAAGDGLRVLLCERDDLASHTSSASTKLVHGGLRYLEHYDFKLVREALIEREVLLRSAPPPRQPPRARSGPSRPRGVGARAGRRPVAALQNGTAHDRGRAGRVRRVVQLPPLIRLRRHTVIHSRDGVLVLANAPFIRTSGMATCARFLQSPLASEVKNATSCQFACNLGINFALVRQ